MNIQAWVNAFVLTPASCPTGVCAHGKSRSGPGVKSRMNSLLCVYGSNVWTLATRLVTVVEVNLRCFCVRLSLLFLVGWFLDLKTVGKKMVKLHVNACQVRKQVTVCWHLVLLEMGVESCRITGKCVWISKPGLMRSCWRRPRVLRVSVRTGNRDLARAWNRGWIVCCVCMGRMFELSLRDLWLSWKWTWGVFVFAWAYSFWWDGFWTLKRSGKKWLNYMWMHVRLENR